jgi:hypothetical protein
VNLQDGPVWRFKPFADCPAVYTSKPPCRFHRFMFWLLLGCKWTKGD